MKIKNAVVFIDSLFAVAKRESRRRQYDGVDVFVLNKKLVLLSFVIILKGFQQARAVEVSPIFGLQVLGGQDFYIGQKGTLTGNASGVIAPAMRFDDNWALLPSLNSSYQGTRQVVNLIGSGSLFQEQMDHRVAAKLIYTPNDSNWRIKPSASFKYELLKETKNEEWSSGLFDYYKWGAGIEAEYVYHDPFSVRFAADYYKTQFPNYTSLESQAALQFQGQSLARELVGDHILDNNNVALSVSVDGPISKRLIVEGYGIVTYQRFPNQALVDASGSLLKKTRDDVITILGFGIKMPAELNSDLRVLGTLDGSATYDTSSQNNYDASRTQFIPFYYNYGELKIGPGFKAYFGPARKPVILGISGTFWYRRYPYRLIQNDLGVYQSETLHSHNWMSAASLTYPMTPRFSLLFNFQYGKSDSNQRFTQFYTYTYSMANYLFGFSYDF